MLGWVIAFFVFWCIICPIIAMFEGSRRYKSPKWLDTSGRVTYNKKRK